MAVTGRYASEIPVIGAPQQTATTAATGTTNMVIHGFFPLLGWGRVYHLKCAPKDARPIEVTVKLSCAKCGGTIPRRRRK